MERVSSACPPLRRTTLTLSLIIIKNKPKVKAAVIYMAAYF